MADQVQLPGMSVVVGEKRCGNCGETKPLSEFHRNKVSRDKHCHQCKECAIAKSRQWYQENKAQVSARAKKYRKQHGDEVRANDRARQPRRRKQNRLYRERRKEHYAELWRNYYQQHGERLRAKQRERYAQNRAEAQEYGRQYYRDHREERIEYTKRYYKEHPEKKRERDRQRRANKAGARGSHTVDQFQALVDFYEVCPCCQEPYTEDNLVTEDHIVPLTWKGTSDFLENIQPLCASCNASKGNRHATDYRDRVREFMMRPDLHSPENFMAVYRQFFTPSQSAPNTPIKERE